MSVHYRFKSALEYDTITFDGLHISVKDLKNAILQQKRIGRSTDFDLRITNAQTEEIYEDENALIPKNTSLLIARIPISAPKSKQWEGYGGNDTPPAKMDEGGAIGKAMDLSSLDAPEDDKIRAMMSQSTQDYDPSNYLKIRGANQVGPVPVSYRCYKCHQGGHWIKDCPLGQGAEPIEIKKSTGIPHSFMVPVEGPQVPGAMMMSNGQYAVPALDLQAYMQKQQPAPPVQELKPEIPDDLLCSICSDLLADAVMIPCCGNSFCDECIRGILLDSEEHECPDCHEKDISPATLIPNRFLRKSVSNFKNTTGYEKKPTFRPKVDPPKEQPMKKEITPPPAVDSTAQSDKLKEERTIISEADSTEQQGKPGKESPKEKEKVKLVDNEGPPGVSPKSSPVHVISSKSAKAEQKKSPNRHRNRSPSPRKHRSPSNYEKRRSPQTPTRDDVPNVITNYDYRSTARGIYGGIPGDIMGVGVMAVAPMQGLPTFPQGQPPPFHPGGPPPNFRLPPPGAQVPPYMPPGSYPPRPVYDPLRAPPSYGPPYSGRSRDYGSRRGVRERTPPGVIDDPLAAFNRILREKDEKRARQQRMARRSWSRSRSRTFSRSPPPMRRRSRSPRRRLSRSRSRSFSITRSRSRSFSPGLRGGSPPGSLRRSSPPLQTRRGRFRSPHRSPPSRRRGIDRDRGDFDREFDRGGIRDKQRSRRADSRDRFYDERDRERDYDRMSRSGGGRGAPLTGSMGQQPPWQGPPRDSYYPDQSGYAPNRYPQQIHHIIPERKYEPIAPPGVEQPPIPGLECELPAVLAEQDKPRKSPMRKERDHHERESRRDREKPQHERRRSRSKSRSPIDKHRNPSPKRSHTPEKPRKRRSSAESSDRKKERREHSEEEKRKNKDKKKHKDKKEDKKKKKDKKEKHHKVKDRKDKKEEFKQVIPKSAEAEAEDSEEAKKKNEKRRLRDEEETNKRLEEERKKEERRLRFLEEEKRAREEEAIKEEAKKKAIEEAHKALEKDEEKEQITEEPTDLYDEIIPKTDIDKEIRSDFKSPELLINPEKVEDKPKIEAEPSKDDEDFNVLELHSEMDLKLEESDILAPVPEKSKWEVDEDGQVQNSPSGGRESSEAKSKVSSEVLKRAENVIFARAIKSIRPVDVKKTSTEKEKVAEEPKKPEPTEKPRLSVKERLGIKVDDPDPNSFEIEPRRTPSPYSSRRDRRIEVRRHDHKRRDHNKEPSSRDRQRHSDSRRSKISSRVEPTKHEREKRKLSRSRTPSEEPKKKKKDKKIKKDKPKKSDEDKKEMKPKIAVEKRKPTLDEANFEPDYDLELHDDVVNELKEQVKKEVCKTTASDDDTSSSETSTTSEDDRKKKKRKSKKKRKKRETSGSDSESSSESSDSDKERKKRKHKKSKKKKKKAKHKS